MPFSDGMKLQPNALVCFLEMLRDLFNIVLPGHLFCSCCRGQLFVYLNSFHGISIDVLMGHFANPFRCRLRHYLDRLSVPSRSHEVEPSCDSTPLLEKDTTELWQRNGQVWLLQWQEAALHDIASPAYL